jgi:hypothetical protein
METFDPNLRINRLLFAMIGDMKLVEKWWSSPNWAFDKRTPAEAFKEDPQAVYDYVMSYVQR